MNVFKALLLYGHDEDFVPNPSPLHFATKYSPGSLEKIEVLRQRVELGLPLWHPKDEVRCSVIATGEKKLVPQCVKVSRVMVGRRKSMLD